MLAGPSAGVGKTWPRLAPAPDRMCVRLDTGRAADQERRLEDQSGSGVNGVAAARGVEGGGGGGG